MDHEVIQWADETMQITERGGRKVILPNREYGDSVTLPDRAEILVSDSTPGWGGHSGVTHFIEQSPPVHLNGLRGQFDEQTHFSAEDSSLFGRMCTVRPDGICHPPQLPQILDYVERNWGWRVDQKVKDLLSP